MRLEGILTLIRQLSLLFKRYIIDFLEYFRDLPGFRSRMEIINGKRG